MSGRPVLRVAMWSGPRNISTAMMRAWENRPDTTVVDEPFYAAYLARTGLDHPGRDEVIASQPTDPAAVVRALETDDSSPVHYSKQMTHHLLEDMPLDWVDGFRNVLLIRDPAEVVSSYVRSRESCEPDDIGLLQQVRLLDAFTEDPPVIDSGDFLRDPESHLRWLCDWLGIDFTDRMLRGRPGCASRTASGRRTGTTRSPAPPASRRGDPGRSSSASTTPPSRRPADRRTTCCGSDASDSERPADPVAY